jgi:hypothetical protein
MFSILESWRHVRRDRPAVAMLVVTGAGAIAVAAVLAVSGAGLLAELVGGLALVPLSLAAALCLLPARLWPDPDDGGGGGDDGDDRPRPSGGPNGAVDWERFESDVWEHIREREAAGV